MEFLHVFETKEDSKPMYRISVSKSVKSECVCAEQVNKVFEEIFEEFGSKSYWRKCAGSSGKTHPGTNDYTWQRVDSNENEGVNRLTGFDKASFHVILMAKLYRIGWELKQYIDSPCRQWTFQTKI